MRASETAEAREARLLSTLEATAEARRGEDARQTTERRVADARRRAMRVMATYKDLQGAAFRYSPNTPYAQTRVLQRGRIEKRCAQCSDLTFEGEPAGLSCVCGKVVLPLKSFSWISLPAII